MSSPIRTPSPGSVPATQAYARRTGGGSGYDGGDITELGKRVKALEEGQIRLQTQFERFSKDMQTLLDETKAVRIDTAEIKGQMKAMPTTLALITAVIGIFAAAGITRWFGH